jgi:hypothetical protein
VDELQQHVAREVIHLLVFVPEWDTITLAKVES